MTPGFGGRGEGIQISHVKNQAYCNHGPMVKALVCKWKIQGLNPGMGFASIDNRQYMFLKEAPLVEKSRIQISIPKKFYKTMAQWLNVQLSSQWEILGLKGLAFPPPSPPPAYFELLGYSSFSPFVVNCW